MVMVVCSLMFGLRVVRSISCAAIRREAHAAC